MPEARRLDRITFEEMIELASQGSRVLQIRAVKFAGKYNVPLRVLHMSGQGHGTLITYEEPAVEAPVVSGIAFSQDEAEITVTGVPDRPGAAASAAEHGCRSKRRWGCSAAAAAGDPAVTAAGRAGARAARPCCPAVRGI